MIAPPTRHEITMASIAEVGIALDSGLMFDFWVALHQCSHKRKMSAEDFVLAVQTFQRYEDPSCNILSERVPIVH